jgi:2-polyprenyl-3-methyl-5-hydroxy-6-metoxy-1,4-benzoquinol methylase
MDIIQAAGGADYRKRLYDRYISARAVDATLTSTADLAPRLPYLRRIISTFFPANREARVLDLGCGHGELLYAARQMGYVHLFGVDVSAEQVQAAHALGITEVKHSDLFTALSSQALASFDLVVTFDVIEHFSKPNLLSLIDEVHRVLKPSGRWLIHTVNAESPFFGRVHYGDFSHETAFTRRSLMTLLKASNFGDVECFEDPIVPRGLNSLVRFLLWRIIHMFLRLYVAVETGDSGYHSIFTQNLLALARPNEQSNSLPERRPRPSGKAM